MIVQKINSKVGGGSFELAYKYFSILSTLNNMNLVKRDMQLIAYSISKDKPINEIKKEFVVEYKSSMATVGNIISKLYSRKVLVKNRREVTVNPALLIDFNQDLGLAINFKHISSNGDKG